MKKKLSKIILSFMLFSISVSGVIFAATHESYFIEKEKDFVIEVDTREDKTNSASFSFEDIDIDAPSVCSQSHVYCEEKTVITTHIKKEWEVIAVPTIWDKSLTPQQFAKYYPNLKNDKPITDGSAPKEKWIAQKILYERGLLDVFPTGKIGYQTEQAVARFQYYKDIYEVNEKLGIVVIGPKTIQELNKLKDRMKNPLFTSRSPLPVIPTEDLKPFHKKRINQLDVELKTKQLPPKAEVLVPQLPIIKKSKTGNLLKFTGTVEIKAQE